MSEWWRVAGAPTADEWQAVFAGAGVVVTGLAAILALIQLRRYIKEREDAARPFLVVDYKFRSILMMIEVRNVSGAVASDIRLSVDKPFEGHMAGRADVLNGLFSDAYRIKQLGPGRSIYWTFDRAPDYYAGDYPRNYEVTASYNDPRVLRRVAPWKIWTRKMPVTYTETFELNIEQWGEANADVDYDGKNWNINSRNEKRVERIAKGIGNLVDALQEANDSPRRSIPIMRRRRR
jgi:hypothetical protein